MAYKWIIVPYLFLIFLLFNFSLSLEQNSIVNNTSNNGSNTESIVVTSSSAAVTANPVQINASVTIGK